MERQIENILKCSIETKESFCADKTQVKNVASAARAIIKSIKGGGKVLLFGNGGSAADSQHIAAEFVGRFKKERKALAAIALTTDTSAVTALANDYGYDMVFARQVEALGDKGDVAVGISTSGNSKNVILALQKARKSGLATIGITGKGGGAMNKECDVTISVDSPDTARVQETHITIGHIICQLVEDAFSG